MGQGKRKDTPTQFISRKKAKERPTWKKNQTKGYVRGNQDTRLTGAQEKVETLIEPSSVHACVFHSQPRKMR